MTTNPESVSAESIGARLKRLRLERGLSQRELSERGVSYAYISRIEAGARTPSVKALRMLARKLGVSVEYLETGTELRGVDDRELRLSDAELELRLADDLTTVEPKLEKILDEALAAGDMPSAARARIALGVSAARRGNHLDAVERLEAAVSDDVVRPQARPDVYAALGQSYAFLGAADRAVRLFKGCLEEIRRDQPDDTTAQIWFATLLSYALTDAGDHAGARETIRRALASAGDEVDPYTRVRLYWSRARLAQQEGRAFDALESIREAIALLKTTDDNVYLGRAYLLSAGVESSEGDAAAAREHLERAQTLLAQGAEPVDLGMIQTGASRVAFLEGDAETAVQRAREAIDALGSAHGGEQGAAVWALARGLQLQGDVPGADSSYQRALDLLTVHGRRHDAALAAGDWGRMLSEHGRDEEATKVLERAAGLGLELETASTRR